MKEKRIRIGIILGVSISLMSISATLSGKTQSQVPESLNPSFADNSPKIDGSLDDEIWKKSPHSKNFITYNPAYGEVLPQKTEVWIDIIHLIFDAPTFQIAGYASIFPCSE